MIASSLQSPFTAACAFRWLSNQLSEEDYGYVLRSLYKVVLHAERQGQTAKQLNRRLKAFEKRCAFPAIFSSLPLAKFLAELEQMQYFYPLYPREVTFSRFGTAPDDRGQPLC